MTAAELRIVSLSLEWGAAFLDMSQEFMNAGEVDEIRQPVLDNSGLKAYLRLVEDGAAGRNLRDDR